MLAALPLVLLLFGAVELVAAALTVLESPTAATAAAVGEPQFLLAVTVAVVFGALESTRSTRLLIAGGAVAALLARIVLTICTFALGGPELTASQSLLNTAGLGLGIAIAAWAVRGLVLNRDLASVTVAPQPAPAGPRPGAPAGMGEPTRSPMTGAEPHPTSPSTPVNPGLRGPQHPGSWSTATTPWPRADEDDPDGTLIRPPRR